MAKHRTLARFSAITLVDRGRELARLGPYESDPDGHLVCHYANTIRWNASMVRTVVETWCEKRGLSQGDIAEFIYQSPLFDPTKRPIVETALSAYLEKNWIVAIHLLVPQIEGTIRLLVDSDEGPIMKPGRHGGQQLRTLHELIDEKEVESRLGTDVAFYLKSLLTDQRGLNVRNDVSHGITPIGGFNAMIADRLLHVLLILGSVPSGESAQDAETTSTPADVANASFPDPNPAQD